MSEDSLCGRHTSEVFSRRAFGRFSAVAVGAAVAGLATMPTANASPLTLTRQDEDVVLGLARTVATLPVEFPAFDESGTALSRVTRDRLRAAAETLTPDRVHQLRQGIAAISAANPVSSTTVQLATATGALVRQSGIDGGLLAVAALAVATVSSHFEAQQDSAARLWLDFTRNFHERVVG